jgi:lipopolysaccharide export system protein LptC
MSTWRWPCQLLLLLLLLLLAWQAMQRSLHHPRTRALLSE